ncbi:hypothetical protein Q3G72_015693 [Acer saccharum]|nr:hypothetical protein Q3G72_015693 [Acer saccharum]
MHGEAQSDIRSDNLLYESFRPLGTSIYRSHGRRTGIMGGDEPFDFEATGVTSQRGADSQQATKGHTNTTAQSGTAAMGHTYTTLHDITAASHIETTQQVLVASNRMPTTVLVLLLSLQTLSLQYLLLSLQYLHLPLSLLFSSDTTPTSHGASGSGDPSLPMERPLQAHKRGWQITSPYTDPSFRWLEWRKFGLLIYTTENGALYPPRWNKERVRNPDIDSVDVGQLLCNVSVI